MGNWASSIQDRKALQRSANIDRIIKEDSKRFGRQPKVFLLGSSGSGKSTVIKQMKIVYQDGFSVEERIAYRTTIYRNLLESAQALVSAMHNVSIEPTDAQNRSIAEQIAHDELDLSSIDSNFRFPGQLASSINRLWCDPAIPQIMDCYRSCRFNFTDNASYFLTEAERIGSPDYVPNETDVLRCRRRTIGIVETVFDAPPLLIHVFEHGIGGRRLGRVWMENFYGSATSIIFCTALGDYDQTPSGQPEHGRLAESIVLFDSVINSRFFSRTSIILFMNKMDVFRNKLPKDPLERYFPNYTGGSDVNAAIKYILCEFTQANRAQLSIYPQVTELVTDPCTIRLVFTAIKETILQNAIGGNETL